jgi:hypothetical protein
MAQTSVAPRWRFLISPRWLAWHAFAVVAFWGMCWLGDWQLRRALGGNSLSWAYTFEWPLFAVMGAFFWAKTIRDEFRLRRDAATGGITPPVGMGAEPTAGPDTHLALLRQEVRGHGRWHGLR